jgi:preprotein translocase subunit YajC
MTHFQTLPLVVAMAQAGQPQNIWLSLAPFALMFAIFYALVILPMRRKQKKVIEFQSSLKVGDRVITTGGLYGTIAKLDEHSIQMQVADKVRIEIARAAIGGYQGQEPVVQSNSGGL